ncbi:MAG: hypothetical protein JRH11_04305 [Deltaproteobacteria bacterium]|nr:hypothetical protein [Deltaproteobacteria bacterium]
MDGILARTLTFLLFLGALGASLGPRAALAQAEDRVAPSQNLSTDPAPPVPDLAIGVDPIAMALGEWGARGELAVTPSHALFVSPGYRTGALSPGISLEIGYHLFPLGDGLDGPFIGPSIGVAVSVDSARVSLRGGATAGWQVILGALALGFSAGVEAHLLASQGAAAIVVPRISLHLGYAIR